MAWVCVQARDCMITKVRYSLTFIKTVCAKKSESLEVCLGLNLDGGFGVCFVLVT